MHGKGTGSRLLGIGGFQKPQGSMLTLEIWVGINLAKGDSISDRGSSPCKGPEKRNNRAS